MAVDLLQSLLDAQGFWSSFVGSSPCELQVDKASMPTSSFSAIAAAFATQGYWAQADLLDYVTLTQLGVWAPLMYILAAAGGLMGVALGAPPKMYVWFMIGPAFYSWLLDTRVSTYGVRWSLPCMEEAQQKKMQSEVWKLAEVGLVNSNLAKRMRASNLDPGITKSEKPKRPVDVSYFFLWYDEVISGTIYSLVEWTGVYALNENSGSKNTNVTIDPTTNQGTGETTPAWFMLADSKWGMIEQITQARLSSPELRDAFATFLASECGDVMKKHIDTAAFAAALNSGGRNLGNLSVFGGTGTSNYAPVSAPSSSAPVSGPPPPSAAQAGTAVGLTGTGSGSGGIAALRADLSKQIVPFPRLLRSALTKVSQLKGLPESMMTAPPDPAPLPANQSGPVLPAGAMAANYKQPWDQFVRGNGIRCDSYALMVLQGFRFEAAHTYYQLVHKVAPGLLSEQQVVGSLLYGWDLQNTGGTGAAGPTPSGETLDSVLRKNRDIHYVQNLVLLYMLRNEIMIAPQLAQPRGTAEGAAKGAVRQTQRSNASANKYGEVYSWALLLPYVQGVMLYLLAMAYPFVCMMVVVPGWHKVIFTWMAFWAWVRLWDLGFAVVRVMERTVWAMIGNSSTSSNINSVVVGLQDYGSVSVTCPGSGAGAASGTDCMIPVVDLLHGASGGVNGAKIDILDPTQASQTVDNVLHIFDKAMVLAGSLDLDLANSYYIFIMAGLYLAVPAATGQLVLGAKSGVSSMVGNIVGGVATETGKAAGTQMANQILQAQKSMANAMGQEAFAKAMRGSGFASNAIAQGNESFARGRAGSMAGAMGGIYGRTAGMYGTTAAARNAFYTEGERLGEWVAGRGDDLAKKGWQGLLNGNGWFESGAGPGSNGRFGITPKEDTGRLGWLKDAVIGKDTPLGKVKGAVQAGAGFVSGMADGGVPAAKIISSYAQAGVSLGLARDQMGQDVAGFSEGAYRSQLDISGSRSMQAANFDAASEAWEAKNAYANSMVGSHAVWGGYYNGLDAGPKPEAPEGLASAGMLNTWDGNTGEVKKDVGNNFWSMDWGFGNQKAESDRLAAALSAEVAKAPGLADKNGNYMAGDGVVPQQSINALRDPEKIAWDSMGSNWAWMPAEAGWWVAKTATPKSIRKFFE